MTSHLNIDSLLFLKNKTRRLITAAGGLESAVQVVRVSKSQLGNYQNPEMLDSFMPIDIVADLEADAGQAIVTSALAELASMTLSPIEKINLVGSMSSRLSRLGKEFGDVFERAAQLAGMGKISPAERQNLLREIEEAIGAAVGLKAAVLEIGKDTDNG